MSLQPNQPPTINSLLKARPSPQRLTGYFMQLLIMHFSDANNIDHPSLRQYIWRQDDPVNDVINSKILITPLAKFDLAVMGIRPAVIIKRRTITCDRDAIGGSYMGGQPLLGTKTNPKHVNGGVIDSNEWATAGQSQKEYPLKGSVTFYCIHEEGASAELLGEEVFNLMLALAPVVMESAGMHDYLPVELGELQVVDEARQHWTVPVTCQFSYRQMIQYRPEAPLLKMIQIAKQLSGD